METLQFIEIDTYENDGNTKKVLINTAQITYIKDFHMETQEPHISYEIGTSDGKIFKTYHDLPSSLKSCLFSSDKL